MRAQRGFAALALTLSAILAQGCAHSRPLARSVENSPMLYPPIDHPYKTGFLRVSKEHELYYEESGNPAGKPVVFLHGGPGSGTKPSQRRFFDPKAYRIILYDQAGAGQSRSRNNDPLKGNTTWKLVEHLEALRTHLGVDKWQLFGGSWGSTLALAYAEAHPEHVSEIIMWGVFLSRPSELEWSYREGGVSQVFPEAFERFASFVSPRERNSLLKAYFKRFHSKDPALRREAVRRWTAFEDEIAQLLPAPPDNHSDADLDDRYLRRALIESYYFLNNSWLNPRHNELLAHVSRLKGIPIVVAAGRYDMVCPHVSAYDLKNALPSVEMHIVPDAGHLSAAHPGIIRELVSATDRFRPHIP